MEKENNIRFLIYHFIEYFSPLDDLPVCTKCVLPINFYSEDKSVFSYPSDINFYYIKKNQLIQLSLVFGENVILKRLAFQGKQASMHPVRIIRGPLHSLVLIFQQKTFVTQSRVRTITSNYKYLYLSNIHSEMDVSQINLPEGKDAVFIGKTDQYIILHNDGNSISHFSGGKLVTSYDSWQKPMHRIFASPLVKGKGILYYDLIDNCLLWSRNVGSHAAVRGFAPDLMNISSKLKLKKDELLIDIQWQTVEGGLFVAAILTDMRLFLVNRDFKVMASVSAPIPASRPHFTSCLWLGASLLYSTNSPPQINYLTLNGSIFPLCSLKHHSSILSIALNDRLFYLQPSINHTEVYSHAVGLLEPLILGYLLVPPNRRDNNCRDKFTKLFQRFDCSRITEKLIYHLDRNGYSDFAYSLIANTKSFKFLEFPVSENSLRFDLSFSLIFEEYKKAFSIKNEEDPEKLLPPSHPLYQKFSDLASNAIEFGQFSIAKRCYQITGNFLSLLYLLIVNKNKKGIEWLDEKSKSDENLRQINFATQKLLESQEILSNFNEEEKLRDWKFNTHYNRALFSTTNIVRDTMKCPLANGDLEVIPLLEELDNLQKWLPLRIEYYSERSLSGMKDISILKGGSEKMSVLDVGGEGDDTEENESEGVEDYLDSPVALLKIPTRPPTNKVLTSTLCLSSNLKKRVFSQLEEAESEESDLSQSQHSEKNMKQNPIKVNLSLNYSSSPRISTGTHAVKDSPQINKKENNNSSKEEQEEEKELSVKEISQQIDENTFVSNSYDDTTLQRFASEFLICGLKKLEANKFPLALEDVNKSIRCLLSTSDPFSKKKEISICVNYKLALKLLILIGSLKKDRIANISNLALFTVMLCTIPMQKKHKLVCLKNAITENMNGKNYGIVAKLIKQITSKDPGLVDSFQNFLEICNENKLENQHSWANQFDISSLHFCYKKLAILSENDDYLICDLCRAVFSKDALEKECSYCGNDKFVSN